MTLLYQEEHHSKGMVLRVMKDLYISTIASFEYFIGYMRIDRGSRGPFLRFHMSLGEGRV